MSPNKEELNILRHGNDLRFSGSLMRQEYSAGKSGDWWADDLKIFSGSDERSATGGVRHVADSTIGRFWTESWSYKSTAAEKQKGFEHTRRQTESVTP